MKPHGYEVERELRRHSLNLTGGGTGSATCTDTATLPMAVNFQDKKTSLQYMETNVATGIGADLPSIMGRVMATENDAVILMREGKEQLVFPGPGGYKILWSPDTKIMPLDTSPSGHLVFNCDFYEELQTAPNMTDNSTSSSSSSSGLARVPRVSSPPLTRQRENSGLHRNTTA